MVEGEKAHYIGWKEVDGFLRVGWKVNNILGGLRVFSTRKGYEMGGGYINIIIFFLDGVGARCKSLVCDIYMCILRVGVRI